MDVKPERLYRREWKRNKPYLPKSTSLPLLRLIPNNRAVFLCKQCGFSNLLVPICLWCCWSSVDARCDFEANARKSLRRGARSAPRLFGKPGLALNSRQDFEFAGKRPRQEGPSQGSTSTAPHVLGGHAVKVFTTTTGPSLYQTKQWSCPSPSNLVRGNGEEDEVVQGRGQTNSETKTESKIGDPCGIGSGENNPEPSAITVEQHPRLKADLITNDHIQEGHKSRTNDSARDSALPPPTLRSPLGLEPCLQLGDRLTISTPCLAAPVHSEARPLSPAPNLIRTMELDASTADTRLVTFTVLNTGQSQLASTTHDTAGTRYEQYTTDRRSGGIQEAEPMDIDVATATQPAPISAMIHAEVSSVKQAQDPDMTSITNTTLTKTGRKRAPIPSILLDQNSYYTPSISDNPASHIPRTTEMTTDISTTTTPTHPATPPRTLRRQKKRLSLSNLGTLVTNSRISSLAPPDPPIPFSPPPAPAQRSSLPQFTPTLPAIVTPPQSPNQDTPHPVLSPAIVISAPVATTPTVTAPSTPVTPLAPNLLQSLPRIGTPKRPYYSTIRASMNGRSSSNISQLSTPPASPSSPCSNGTPGIPGSHGHTRLSTDVAQKSASMVVDSTPTSMVVDGVRTPRPASTPVIVSVPPLPPVVNAPGPSSPVRSVLSVFDPANGEDDDNDEEGGTNYRQFGVASTSRFGKILRERRSGIFLKDKDKGRGDKGGGGYHFSLSFSRSLGRKRSGTYANFSQEPEGKELDSPLPTPSMNRGYAGVGGFGPGRGYSMSGEVEMRMALAERNINAGCDSENSLGTAFKFRENQRPSCDGDGGASRGKGRKLIKMRSTIGLTSSSFTSSSTSSPSKPRIGSRLKEMSYSFLGRFQGGDASHS